jgi:hypothetical protein
MFKQIESKQKKRE